MSRYLTRLRGEIEGRSPEERRVAEVEEGVWYEPVVVVRVLLEVLLEVLEEVDEWRRWGCDIDGPRAGVEVRVEEKGAMNDAKRRDDG